MRIHLPARILLTTCSLVTPMRLQRKRHLRSLKKRRTEAQKETVSDYKALVAKHAEEKKAKVSAVRAAKKARK
jgi:small subunit ribosomal protein S6e